MLPQLRYGTVQRSLFGKRSYAKLPLRPAQKTPSTGPTQSINRVPVQKDHPLYLFFHQKHSSKTTLGERTRVDGEFKYVTLQDAHLNQAEVVTGRAWRTSELRLKSFEDLHVLWYITLRERNVLATQKEEARRLGLLTLKKYGSADAVSAQDRLNVQRTMRRIKIVFNERRRAYEGAIRILKTKREQDLDQQVLNFKLHKLGQLAAFNPKRRWTNEETVVHKLVMARRLARKERKIRRKAEAKQAAKERVKGQVKKPKKKRSEIAPNPLETIIPGFTPSTSNSISL